MSLIHLSTELRQELKLTPQLLQSMEVLQMNSQELLDYLNQVSEENPLVEQSDLSQLPTAYGASQTGRPRASPPSSVTSWSGCGCPSRCWPCPGIWRSWWMRTAASARRIWTAWWI